MVNRDAQLVENWLQGDERAGNKLVERNHQKLLSVCFQHCGQDQHRAEELAQDAWIRAFNNLEQFDPKKASFTTWLCTIGRNLCYNKRTQMKGRAELLEKSGIKPKTATGSGENQLEAEDYLNKLLARACLTELQTEAFTLRYVYGMKLREMAEEMDRSLVAVKNLLYRVRWNLNNAREELERSEN